MKLLKYQRDHFDNMNLKSKIQSLKQYKDMLDLELRYLKYHPLKVNDKLNWFSFLVDDYFFMKYILQTIMI